MASNECNDCEDIRVTVEFSGGAEFLFNNEKRKQLSLPANEHKWTLRHLINYLKVHHLKEREELFVQGDSIRPGIIIMVNEVDWELIGEGDYQLKSDDQILFISTLHGG